MAPTDKEFAGHLVRNLEGASQPVSEALLELAMTSAWFRKSRFKSGQGRKPNVGGRGLGYNDKPSTGTSNVSGANLTRASPVRFSSCQTFIHHSSFSAGLFIFYCLWSRIQSSEPYYRPATSSSTSGPSGGRLAAMKAAFQSQYKSQVIGKRRLHHSILI